MELLQQKLIGLPDSGILNPLFYFFIINCANMTDTKLIHVILKSA